MKHSSEKGYRFRNSTIGCNYTRLRLLLVDSTGLEFLREGAWKRKKHQPEYCRQFTHQCHQMIAEG